MVIEQTGLSQDEGARTHADDTARRGDNLLDPTPSCPGRGGVASTPGYRPESPVSISFGFGIASVTNARLPAARTGRPSADATLNRYPPSVISAAPVNTPCGPTTSGACTPWNP